MPIEVSVSEQAVQVSTSGQTVSATVSGGVGPAGAAGATTWDGITDKPATFAPSAHAASHGSAGADPLSVAVSQVSGLQAALDAKQASGAYATLDGSGKVPSAQLPSYVDDVLEYQSLGAFPAAGAAGVIYVAIDTRRAYRWSGSAYLEISPSEVTSVAGKTGAVSLVAADVSGAVSTDDARLANARTPTKHAASHQSGGADAIFDQDLNKGGDVSFVSLTVTDAGTLLLQGDGITFADSTNQTTAYTGKIGSVAGLPIVTGAAGVLQAGAFGTAAGQVCQGNDSRLSDARVPTAHTHAASDITSGTIAAARLGSGAADATTFLRGDQTYAAPPVTSVDGSTGAVTITKSEIYDFTATSKPASATGSGGSYSWTVPTGAKAIQILCVGAGGGGGSGRRGATSTARGGGGGGAAGAPLLASWAVSELPSTTLSINSPAGGAGASAVTTDNTDGSFGSDASSACSVTSSGYLLLTTKRASGGGAGTTAGGSGFGFWAGDAIDYTTFGGASSGAAGSATGAGANTAQNNRVTCYGGGGGGAATSANASGAGGDSLIPYGGTQSVYYVYGTDATQGGTAGGGNGSNGKARNAIFGPLGGGGSGGGGNASGAGGSGGNGAFPGGGGGGGGASLNGNASGKGGNGGGALVRITVLY